MQAAFGSCTLSLLGTTRHLHAALCHSTQGVHLSEGPVSTIWAASCCASLTAWKVYTQELSQLHEHGLSSSLAVADGLSSSPSSLIQALEVKYPARAIDYNAPTERTCTSEPRSLMSKEINLSRWPHLICYQASVQLYRVCSTPMHQPPTNQEGIWTFYYASHHHRPWALQKCTLSLMISGHPNLYIFISLVVSACKSLLGPSTLLPLGRVVILGLLLLLTKAKEPGNLHRTRPHGKGW